MKKYHFLTLIVLVIAFGACKQSKNEKITIDPAFKEYITAFTSGSISSEGNIRVQLASEYAQEIVEGSETEEKLFNFDPGIKGKSYWIDSRTIEFRPEKPLPSGKSYKCEFQMRKLTETPDRFKSFPFRFDVIKQSFYVQKNNLKPYDQNTLTKYKYEGKLVTADVIDNEKVESLIKAYHLGEPLPVQWKHESANKTHYFQVDSIKRLESDESFFLEWDGSAYDIEVQGKNEIEVPGLSNFKIINMYVNHQPNQYVVITFSDPIGKKQNLNGLVKIKNVKNLRLVPEANMLKVFLGTRIAGSREITISKSIRNIMGYKLKEGTKRELTFEASKPDVRLIGKGVIVPSSNGLTLPFEAINLNAVDVKVIRIFEDNIAQFLQVNHLDGDYQLKRVGRLIAKEKIALITDNIIDLGRWNAFSIDLDKIIKTEPGALYKIEISFRKKYSLYPCENESEDEELEEEDWNSSLEAEMSYWDAAENYYNNDGYYYYNWRERDNPCDHSYYSRKKASRNFLASDLGLIAKIGKNGKMSAIVTDINTTQPLEGVEIDIYNYQQQVIATSKTNNKGIAEINFSMKPFLLVAKQGTQRGYLKLNDGTSLSLSKFDVGGAQVQKGLKGFIYGERGVWRPGDTLFLTFVLEDKEGLVPDGHPVIFELIDPSGKTKERLVRSQAMNGFYNFTTMTNADAPTGNWMAKIRIGGALFTKTIKIETVKPNRLKIKLDFGSDQIKASEQQIKGELEVKWLHGAIAKNLKAEVMVTLKTINTRFEKFRDYIFDDPSVDFETEEETIFEGRIDENGKASIAKSLKVNDQAPGMLQARFLTTVFEEGGNSSVDQFTIPYVPYKNFVGVKVPKGDKRRGMLLTDTKHKIEIASVDDDGNPISMNNIKLKVYKVEWRWWWQSGSDNLASYMGRNRVVPIISKSISTVDGYGSTEIEVKYPDWGRYLIKVISPEGHSTGKIVYIDWPGWAGRSQRENPGAASMLTFSADKENYSVGEQATLTFPSSEGSRALISLESGAKVINMFWVDCSKEESKFTFDITPEMAPNIYANITMLQPHANTANDLPIRLYGVIPLMVNDPTTRIEPVIEMPDELKPEGMVNIKVKEKNGKPMTFTLAMVDEGLLDLTRFKTPDPWKVFYAREALSVKTWDIYDMVLGAYGGNIEQVFAIGGDGNLLGQKNKKADRFKPVVRFFGPFTLEGKETKDIQFEMPRYVGSVRTMVVAGNNKAYGFADKATPVKNPLMMLATLPRVVSPGENVKLPVTIFAMDENIKNVKVKLKTNSLFKINGQDQKELIFDQPDEKDFVFDLTASNQLGIAKVELVALGGKEQATYEIELDVRAPNPIKTNTYSAVIKPGDKWEQDVNIFGIKGSNEAVLEISGMPPIDLERRLRYLIRYPYGCVEQTTSSVFPQLYIGQVMELDKDFKNRIHENVVAGIKRLQNFQIAGGGFSYWPGSSYYSDWSTCYAGHFLIEAERNGYEIPNQMRSQWISHQKEKANNWNPYAYDQQSRGDLIQAYRVYTLALANEPDLGAMNRLKEFDKLSLQARYLLAMAYMVSGNEVVGKELIQGSERNIADYKEMGYTYGSGDRDRAIILETLIQLKMYDEAMPLIKHLSERLNRNYWMSTQTTVFCLKAMIKAADIFKKSADEFQYSYKLQKEKAKEVMSTSLVNKHIIALDENDSINHLLVKNTSKVPFYVNLSVEGLPIKPDLEKIRKNLDMTVTYKDMDDKVISVDRLMQGTDFKVEIKVTNSGIMNLDYKEMALTTIFPSGWEIHNSRLYGGGESHMIDEPTYKDIRDDRVHFFFNLRKRESKTFVVLLNASYLGSYVLPAIQCQAMYNNEIQARTPGKNVQVVLEQ